MIWKSLTEWRSRFKSINCSFC